MQKRLLYSDAIYAFIEKISRYGRDILVKETDVRLQGKRIAHKNYLYSLKYVVFEDEKMLGYFSSAPFEIGVHKLFLFTRDDTALINLLRHELAHMITYLKYGNSVEPHGEAYHNICRKYGWGKEVYSASVELSSETLTVGKAEEAKRILAKIHKLLSLAASTNPHEAQAATLKANELLLEHNLTLDTAHSQHNEDISLRILPSKRADAKFCAISQILRTFFVYPIISHGEDGVYLEIFGSKENVAIADYVADFLDKTVDILWDKAKANNHELKGTAAKNSFFRGVAAGYLEQVNKEKRSQSADVKNQLIRIETALTQKVSMAYPHLRMSRSSYVHSETAASLGKKAGASLQIRRPLGSSGHPLLITN